MKLLTIIMKKVHRNSIKITVDLWGNPLTTKELFAYVRETGFDFVRIPVTYKNHFKMEPGYEIDKAWLDRVQQIVDYALECDLKVIINIHHDCTTSGDNKIWFIADLAHYDTTRDILTSLWSQIAERFKDYDNNLIFETLNEPAYANTKYQGHGNDESRYVLGKLNIETLNAIRATGGENESRFVMLPTHGACNNYDTNSAFVFPDDPHVLVSVHGYVETDSKFHDITVWHNLFMIQKFFLNKGYGTVIGEFGEIIHPEDTEERLQIIAADFKLQVEVADKFGVPSCFWDDGGEHHIIDRRTLTPYCAQTLAALTGYTQE